MCQRKEEQSNIRLKRKEHKEREREKVRGKREREGGRELNVRKERNSEKGIVKKIMKA